jgi:hypothetical protein
MAVTNSTQIRRTWALKKTKLTLTFSLFFTTKATRTMTMTSAATIRAMSRESRFFVPDDVGGLGKPLVGVVLTIHVPSVFRCAPHSNRSTWPGQGLFSLLTAVPSLSLLTAVPSLSLLTAVSSLSLLTAVPSPLPTDGSAESLPANGSAESAYQWPVPSWPVRTSAAPGGQAGQVTPTGTIRNPVGTDRPHHAHTGPSTRPQLPAWPSYRPVLVGALAALSLTAASVGILKVIRDQGVRLTGDEPHYLVDAEAIGRFHSIDVSSAYLYAVGTHNFVQWPYPTPEQIWWSHGSTFAFHNLGLPFLLALPVNYGGRRGAELALLVLIALLTTVLSYLVGKVSGVRSPWSMAIAGLFLSPAYLLASTQIYPDLLSGLMIAIAVMLIAQSELLGRWSNWHLIWCGLFIGFLPWLHTQNILFAIILAAALVVVRRRRGPLPARPLLMGLGVAMAFWVLLVAYNLYVYGRLGGPPGETFSWGATTWTRIVALLFGGQQGILVQFPIILLGVAALWVYRRRLPVTAIATAAVVIAIVVSSGAFGGTFGGTSFLGRFQWAAAPVLLAFAGLYLLKLFKQRRSAAVIVSLLIVGLYVGQLVPILNHDHVYYNQVGSTLDPTGGGWWGPINHFLPGFNQLTAAWSSPRVLWGVLCLVAIAGLVVTCSVRLLAPPERKGTTLLAGAAVVVTAIFTAASAAQVMAPQTFYPKQMPSQVGHVVGRGRVVTGSQSRGALMFGPGWTFPPGQYEATISYRLDDPSQHAAPADVTLDNLSPSTHAVTVLHTYLSPSALGSKKLSFSVPAGRYLFVRVFWSGTGTLLVNSLRLVQTANG